MLEEKCFVLNFGGTKSLKNMGTNVEISQKDLFMTLFFCWVDMMLDNAY